MTPNVAASIKERLKMKAKLYGEELELFLVRYTCERFLYRLGVSEMRQRCVLKGAGLLNLWMNDPYRSTRDVDLLASGKSDPEVVRNVVRTICAVRCPEDGLVFDTAAIEVAPIREEAEYHGQRAVMNVYLGKARIRLQIDFGFGDSVTPGPEDAKYPVMLEHLPAPSVRTYPKAVMIAEKFESMVRLGRTNSRMKDFHDIWALSSEFGFDGEALKDAISKCFERRKTPWTPYLPDVLTPAFYGDSFFQERWASYIRSAIFRTAPPMSFDSIGEQICAFLVPLRESIVENYTFGKAWSVGKGWE